MLDSIDPPIMQALPGHNQGPSLDDELPEWQVGELFLRFCWRKAHKAAWDEEYTLEILERGRNLQPEDHERIEAIKRARDLP